MNKLMILNLIMGQFNPGFDATVHGVQCENILFSSLMIMLSEPIGTNELNLPYYANDETGDPSKCSRFVVSSCDYVSPTVLTSRPYRCLPEKLNYLDRRLCCDCCCCTVLRWTYNNRNLRKPYGT